MIMMRLKYRSYAQQVITNEDAPVKAVRTKKDSSMVKGLNMVKTGRETSSFPPGIRGLS